MNALAEDQLGHLRGLLAGTGIPFGMYVGKTPEHEAAVAGIRLVPGASRAQYEAKLAEVRREKRSEAVYPSEEVCSREVMRTAGRQRKGHCRDDRSASVTHASDEYATSECARGFAI